MSSNANQEEELCCKNMRNTLEIQTQFYIRHEKCAFPGCLVELFWYDAGQYSTTACFEAQDVECTCEKEYPVLCCTKHKYTYKCDQCESLVNEHPDIAATLARIYELEQELQFLKSELIICRNEQ